MALGPAILLDVALNPRVQEVAGRLFGSVYSRIFKDGSNKPAPMPLDVEALSPEQQPIAERLVSIERQIAQLPTDNEMAAAFASLQAEVRIGQKRLWVTVLALGAINAALISILHLG